VRAEMLHAARRTYGLTDGRTNKSNSRFSQFYERA